MRLIALTPTLVLAPLALAACATTMDAPIVDGGPPAAEGTPVALNQPVAVGPVVATPKEVTEDSRCPMNARCVWAGRVVLTTRIDGAGWRETVPLTLGEPYSTHGATVVLIRVEPDNMTGQTIDPADYRFLFAEQVDQ